MKPLSAEIKALKEVLHQPLESFVTQKELDTHKDPEGLAQTRMFTKALEAAEAARMERTSWMIVLRFGTVSVTYQAFGPYQTQAQAGKAVEGILSAVEATAYALVPTRSHEGWKALLEAADAPPAEMSQWAEVRRDAEARRNGWRGKARERDNYLKGAS